jgi:cardiolipin synthase
LFEFLTQAIDSVADFFGGAPAPKPPPAAPPPPPGDAPVDVKQMGSVTEELFHAMDGLGTDEAGVLGALRGRSAAEIAEVRKQYQKRYGRSLDAELESELGGKDLEVARAEMVGDPVGAAVTSLVAATAGVGTNEKLLLDTLRGLPDQAQRKAVADQLKERTGKSLDDLLGDELSGKDLDQARLLADGKRAAADAVRLDEAMHGGFLGLGTDEKEIKDTLEEAPPERRTAIAAAYGRRTGAALASDLDDELSGDDATIAKDLIAGDEVGAAVARLHAAGDGMGTDENELRHVLAGASPDELVQIQARYRKEHGEDLRAMLDSELSGHERVEIESLLVPQAGAKFGSPEFQAALDATTGSTNRAGNDVNMLFDGVNSFAERDRLIDEAKGSINLQTFIFNSDETGWDLAHRLAAKADEGVTVRIIYDALGSGRADPAMFEFLKEHGVEVRAHAPLMEDPLDANHRWHEKHLIVDGETSIEGGMNIADEYAWGGTDKKVTTRGGADPWRDADAELTGPAVADAEKAFLSNWASVGDPVSPDEEKDLTSAAEAPEAVGAGVNVRVVHHRPNEDKDNNTENLYLQAIRSSQTAITIENAYFIPSEEMRMELIAAARRGVKVRIMTNSRQSNDNTMVADASRSFDAELVAAGIEFHEKEGGTLHAKTASFDGQFSIVGSANLNGRSRGCDSEDVLAIEDTKTAEALDARFDAGLKQTHGVSAEDLQKDSTFAKLREDFFSLARDVF